MTSSYATPGSSPVPRWMARLMLSAGMFSALAAAMAPRRRGFVSGSPPPFLAAMEISLIRRVKILPRLASSAPFLCLIVAHFEWPDMGTPRIQCTLVAQDSPVEEIKGLPRNGADEAKL